MKNISGASAPREDLLLTGQCVALEITNGNIPHHLMTAWRPSVTVTVTAAGERSS